MFKLIGVPNCRTRFRVQTCEGVKICTTVKSCLVLAKTTQSKQVKEGLEIQAIIQDVGTSQDVEQVQRFFEYMGDNQVMLVANYNHKFWMNTGKLVVGKQKKHFEIVFLVHHQLLYYHHHQQSANAPSPSDNPTME